MGGYSPIYVDTSLVTVDSGHSIGTIRTSRINATSTLVAMASSTTGRVFAAVAGYASAPAFAFGTVVEVTSGDADASSSDPKITRLDATTWLIRWSRHWARVSVSGTAVTVIDRGSFDPFAVLPAPYDAYPFGGNIGDARTSFVFGVDYDHVVMSCELFDYGAPYFQRGWAIVELVPGDVATVTVVQGGTDVGYVWAGAGAAYDAGEGEIWTTTYPETANDGTETYTGSQHFSVVTITATGVSVADIGVWPGFGLLRRATDGSLWGQGGFTNFTWTPSTPVRRTYEHYLVTASSMTLHTYIQEWTHQGDFGFAAGGTLMMGPGGSWRTDDLHYRAEDYSPFFSPEDYADVPGAFSTGDARATIGMEAAASILVFRIVGGAVEAFAMQEQPIGPFADMDAASTALLTSQGYEGDRPLHVDYDGTNSLYETADSYWHPIVTFEWIYDDGDSDSIANPTATASHDFTRPSVGHIAGALSAPDPRDDSYADAGTVDWYLPTLHTVDSLGRQSIRVGAFPPMIHVLGVLLAQVRQRQIPGLVRQRQIAGPVRQRQMPR